MLDLKGTLKVLWSDLKTKQSNNQNQMIDWLVVSKETQPNKTNLEPRRDKLHIAIKSF